MTGATKRALVTLLWGVTLALLGAAFLPALDWVGEVMGFPPTYHTANRILLVAIGVVAVVAIWRSYPAPDTGRPRSDSES